MDDGSKSKILSLTSALGNESRQNDLLRQDLRKAHQEMDDARGSMHDILNLANDCEGYVDVQDTLSILDDIRRIVVNFLNRGR